VGYRCQTDRKRGHKPHVRPPKICPAPVSFTTYQLTVKV
jgi:hypothetical protein